MLLLKFKKTVDRAQLLGSRFKQVHLLAERLAAGQVAYVPADVLTGCAHAEKFAVERVMGGQVFGHQGAHFGHQWRRKVSAGT